MYKIDQSVGKCLYFNALTESERLNDSEYRSETCSEAELIVVRPERTEPLRHNTILIRFTLYIYEKLSAGGGGGWLRGYHNMIAYRYPL